MSLCLRPATCVLLSVLAPDILIFVLGLSYDLSKFSDNFTPLSSTLKDHN